MYAPAIRQDNSAPGSLESMGYSVDGYWKEVHSGPGKYRVPSLAIGLFPAPRFKASAAAYHLNDVQSPAAEIHCTILDEVRQTADRSFYLIPRLRITVQAQGSDKLKRPESETG